MGLSGRLLECDNDWVNDDLPDPLPSGGSFEQVSVPSVYFALGKSAETVRSLLSDVRAGAGTRHSTVAFCIDDFFDCGDTALSLGARDGDVVMSIATAKEPSNLSVDSYTAIARQKGADPCCVVGYGGGITLDTAKAISNLLTNPGVASQYQGWDLLTEPGVHKIGVPTLSGTGAEASRTCVLTNAASGAKLGMNSKFSLFDAVVLDPTLTNSVPRDQFFFTGMDTYMHCIESLHGRFRNPISDAYSRQSLALVREVFGAQDMMIGDNRSKLMVASLLGGSAIAGSYVGLVHPMSAALSVVLDTHHGVGNCIVMRAMESFYPAEYTEFWEMADRQGVEIPWVGGSSFTESQLDRLVDSTLVHERPLSNALGVGFRDVLSRERLKSLFAML
jgi:3-deoxy-alpha-D-manno-octulosonate 8-oxidase